MQCAQLHQAALRTHHPTGNLSQRASLSLSLALFYDEKRKNKAFPGMLCLTTHLPQKKPIFDERNSAQAPPVGPPDILPGMQM